MCIEIRADRAAKGEYITLRAALARVVTRGRNGNLTPRSCVPQWPGCLPISSAGDPKKLRAVRMAYDALCRFDICQTTRRGHKGCATIHILGRTFTAPTSRKADVRRRSTEVGRSRR